MATYVIGDVQGCFDELVLLFEKINFSKTNDVIVFAGDLVNRGKRSLDVLRFIKALQQQANCHVVLGNHDLHLLAVFYRVRDIKKQDTFQDILLADDASELCDWLRQQSMLFFDEANQSVITHAGIAPTWTISQAIDYARELEQQLQSTHYQQVLSQLFGTQPNHWDDSLFFYDRLRVICNVLTRMRFCFSDGSLDFIYKGKLGSQPKNLIPWFQLRKKLQTDDTSIVFGHWAALEGHTGDPQYVCVDTGCIWGNTLSAYRLEDKTWFQVSSSASGI